MIAGLAAKRRGQNQFRAIETTIDQFRSATMNAFADELIALNETFHDQIHAASECRYLARMKKPYDAGIRRIIHVGSSEREKALVEHVVIGAAMNSGQSDEAERAMRDHVARSGNTYLKMVSIKQEGNHDAIVKLRNALRGISAFC